MTFSLSYPRPETSLGSSLCSTNCLVPGRFPALASSRCVNQKVPERSSWNVDSEAVCESCCFVKGSQWFLFILFCSLIVIYLLIKCNVGEYGRAVLKVFSKCMWLFEHLCSGPVQTWSFRPVFSLSLHLLRPWLHAQGYLNQCFFFIISSAKPDLK